MATIIKREAPQHASGTALRAAAYNLTDMAEHAEDYLAMVRGEAQKIVEGARTEAIAIREQAQRDGRQAAEDAVDQMLDKKVARQMVTLTPALHAVIQQIDDARQDWLRHWEASAVKLAAAIAGRLMRRQLDQTPEIAGEWVREALHLTAGASEATIRLHPEDLDSLGRQTEQLVAAFRPMATARIVGDDAISRGGCRVETELGSVDKQLETQLQRMIEELT